LAAISLALFATFYVRVDAQQSGQANRLATLQAQVDRIFKDREYDAPRFGPARWLPDGTAYTIVERSGDESQIARYDAASGRRSVVAKVKLDIDNYQWSPDGKRLLIFTNTRKVWRQNTRGDYWLLELEDGDLKKLGGNAQEATMMFAKFSPDSSRIAFVRGNNIFVQRLNDDGIIQLTRDGSETKINGTSDWVNEEELSIRDGFRWSPDGKNIAYWQFDTTGVGIFTLIDDTTANYPSTTRIPYPKAGTTNSAARIGIVSSAGGETRWMKVDGDPRNNYLTSLEWADSSTLAMQHLNRQQNRNDFLLADMATGTVKRVFRDESKTWVDTQSQTIWVNDGKAFLWLSERDGWRHIYRIPRAGGDAKLITQFDADVTRMVGADSTNVYFLASPSNATQRYLYRAALDGTTAPEIVTPTNQPGTHSYEIAPGGKLAFHTWSAFDRVPETDVIELPSHRSLRALTNRDALKNKVAALVTPPVEFVKVDVGGGVNLDGWMLKPPSFDPSRKYPAIVHVYGEPASQTVLDSWEGGRMLFHRALAQAGYIVVSFDNRGTPAPKGEQWRKIIYGTVGELSAKEQAAAIQKFASEHSFIDAERIGVWGWSGGGSNTLNCMFRFPDVYKVGVAVAPVPDQKLYDTIYQERYMGVPWENSDGYSIGSPINFAGGLKGKLLIVHGSGDDNVHYQGTERLVNRLVELGKPFDMMVYPNRTHAISEGPGTAAHIYQLIARYFVEHLPPQ
jgi:dipeptidyl-peptidase-4